MQKFPAKVGIESAGRNKFAGGSDRTQISSRGGLTSVNVRCTLIHRVNGRENRVRMRKQLFFVYNCVQSMIKGLIIKIPL